MNAREKNSKATKRFNSDLGTWFNILDNGGLVSSTLMAAPVLFNFFDMKMQQATAIITLQDEPEVWMLITSSLLFSSDCNW